MPTLLCLRHLVDERVVVDDALCKLLRVEAAVVGRVAGDAWQPATPHVLQLACNITSYNSSTADITHSRTVHMT